MTEASATVASALPKWLDILGKAAPITSIALYMAVSSLMFHLVAPPLLLPCAAFLNFCFISAAHSHHSQFFEAETSRRPTTLAIHIDALKLVYMGRVR